MHGDYCGWHSVNARFYILILKLQTKIIRDKSNYIHDETEKYSKCFLLSSALTPDPATSPSDPRELLTQEHPWVHPPSFLPSFTLLRALHRLGSLPQFNYLHERLSSGSASWRNPIT